MRRKIIKLLVFISIFVFMTNSVNADSGKYLVKFKTDISDIYDMSHFKEVNKARNIYSFSDLEDLKDKEAYIEYYDKNDKVELIAGKERITMFTIPKDNYFSEQWQLTMTKADYVWNFETYGNDIKVAVIDSGSIRHSDLQNNLLEGRNYLNNSDDTNDTIGHGTHVSGIIAAEINNSGIVGAAPKAKIIPLKCFDAKDNPTVEMLVSAIEDAVDVYHCDVINMSWGRKTDNQFLKEAIKYAYDKGVIMVAAVGNDYSDELRYPAAYEEVIGVGSVGKNKEKSTFSQYNTSVFVVAPGEDVRSTYNDNSYVELSGTSQAAPWVSSLAALALSANPDMTNKEFMKLLQETSEDLGDVGYDTKYGCGLINAKAAINTMLDKIDYYVSLVNTENNQSYVYIKNNTDSTMNGKSIFVNYDGGLLQNPVIYNLSLAPGESEIVKTDNVSNPTHFLWRNSDNLSSGPIAGKREKCTE